MVKRLRIDGELDQKGTLAYKAQKAANKETNGNLTKWIQELMKKELGIK